VGEPRSFFRAGPCSRQHARLQWAASARSGRMRSSTHV
jgi:hypothetical protein